MCACGYDGKCDCRNMRLVYALVGVLVGIVLVKSLR
jgi:hypothetical protein